MLGASGAMQRRKARLDGRDRRLSQRRRHLHRLYHARLSRQIHALHEPAAGFAFVLGGGADLRTRDSCFAALYAVFAEQRAELAQADTVMWGGHSCPPLLNLLLNLEVALES